MLTAVNLLKTKRQERKERLRIALVMIGSGVLDGGKREAGGRGSEDRGKGTVSRGGAEYVERGEELR